MGRPLRTEIEGAWYHVMNRGVARETIFFADVDRVEFERLLGVGYQRFGVEVHAYCLMSNHFHLLVHCPRGGLSDFMHQLGSVYVRHVNERVGRDGPLFRSRFHSIPVDSDAYLLSAARYVHRNPLGIRPEVQLDRYRWSSHRIYLQRRAAPPWFREGTILGMFGGDRSSFDRFVRIQPEPEGSGHRRPPLAALIQLVVDEHGLEGTRQSVERSVGLLVLDRSDGERARELRAELGTEDGEAERAAIRRARRRLAAQPELSPITDRVSALAA
jgi:REP element-mobilizing transposase RayT